MVTQQEIDRINFLYHKSQKEGLTDAEKEEQAALRKHYVASVRESFKSGITQYRYEPNPPSHDPRTHSPNADK